MEARALCPRLGLRHWVLDATGRGDGDQPPRRVGGSNHALERDCRRRRHYRRQIVGSAWRSLRWQGTDVDRLRRAVARPAVVAGAMFVHPAFLFLGFLLFGVFNSGLNITVSMTL